MTDTSGQQVVGVGGSGRGSSSPRRHVVVAVPGLAGGVDEAARYLLPGGRLDQNWTSHTLVTKGQRSWLAPVVFSGAMVRLVLLRLLKKTDIVHLNMSSRGSTLRKLLLSLLARMLGVPYVVQLHGGGFAVFVEGLPVRIRRQVVAMLGRAEHIFVLGEPFRDFLIESLGIDGAKVSIIRNAVPVSGHPATSESVVAAISPTILFTGRVNINKGAFDLLDALDRLRDLEWSAILAGDGETQKAIDRVGALDLEDRIEIRSWQSRSAVEELLAEASIFVLPSRLEALSVSLLEAMAAKLCCIATAVGAQGEILVDHQNCLLVKPGDVDELAEVLRTSLTDVDLRLSLGAAAHKSVVEQCSIGVVRGELLAVYGDVVDQP